MLSRSPCSHLSCYIAMLLEAKAAEAEMAADAARATRPKRILITLEESCKKVKIEGSTGGEVTCLGVEHSL